jgi:hypothetical protein
MSSRFLNLPYSGMFPFRVARLANLRVALYAAMLRQSVGSPPKIPS